MGGALGLVGGLGLVGWAWWAWGGGGDRWGWHRAGGARLRLGLAAYSFRQHFGWMRGKRQEAEAPEMDMMGFVDYCAEHGGDGAEITSYFLAGEADDRDLLALRRHAFLRGVSVCGTAIGNDGRIADILRGTSYQGWVVLEYEADDPHGKIPGELRRLREALGGDRVGE